MSVSAPERKERTTVEVSLAARYRLRNVAAKRNLKMKELLDDLAEKAERETFGKVQATPYDVPTDTGQG